MQGEQYLPGLARGGRTTRSRGPGTKRIPGRVPPASALLGRNVTRKLCFPSSRTRVGLADGIAMGRAVGWIVLPKTRSPSAGARGLLPWVTWGKPQSQVSLVEIPPFSITGEASLFC